MGNLAAWAASNPDTVKHWESTFGLPQDGTYDPEIQKRIESYQLLLGQQPGQTSDTDAGVEWTKLNQQIDARRNTNTALDSQPMRDTAFQAFLRESGAQESSLLDEIRARTDQTSRDINIQAAGSEAQRAEAKQGYAAEREQGTKNIKSNFEDRGFVGSSMQDNATQELNTDVERRQGVSLGGIDEQEMSANRARRDALAAFASNTRGSIASLYRRRVDEEQQARDRVRLTDAEMKYPGG